MEYVEGVIKNTEFFTTAELAKKLKMNVQVITRKVQAGEIRAFKIGKDWRIPESAVHEWLERHANDNGNGNGHARKAKVVEDYVRNDHIEELPSKPFERKYLLEFILAQFDPSKTYSEDEVTHVISRYYDDFVTVRREFIAERMLEKAGGGYRRRSGYKFSD
jgi:excisionase family DNA binding protein